MNTPPVPSGYKHAAYGFYNSEDLHLGDGGLFDEVLLDDIAEVANEIAQEIKSKLPPGAINITITFLEGDYVEGTYHRPMTESEKEAAAKAEEAKALKAMGAAQKKKLKDLQTLNALIKANPEFVEHIRGGKSE